MNIIPRRGAHYNRQVADVKRGYIGMGSNLGNRLGNIQHAIELMQSAPGLAVEAVSAVYEAPPWGYASEHSYINAVAMIAWQGTPHVLLETCHRIEAALGRVWESPQRSTGYTDRVIDLDILWLDGVELDDATLTLPHPLAHRRAFALKPWLELAPELVLHGKTLNVWLAELPREEVKAVRLAVNAKLMITSV
jgi:2-amino-4-hydroxy-6-hydroxymethyldihydropteridine diphosphokinase